MPKIYLTPSNRSWNICACGDNEYSHSRRYIDLLTAFFDNSEIEWKINKTGSLQDGVRECGEWRADIHYSVRTACFDGRRRASTIYVTGPDSEARCIAGMIKEGREKIYSAPVRVSAGRDYELRCSPCLCICDEIVYHDNREDAIFFHNNMQSAARETASAFCRYFGLPTDNPCPENIAGTTAVFDEYPKDEEEEMISHIGPFPEDNGFFHSILVGKILPTEQYGKDNSAKSYASSQHKTV